MRMIDVLVISSYVEYDLAAPDSRTTSQISNVI
jgi:hypothetical protein